MSQLASSFLGSINMGAAMSSVAIDLAKARSSWKQLVQVPAVRQTQPGRDERPVAALQDLRNDMDALQATMISFVESFCGVKPQGYAPTTKFATSWLWGTATLQVNSYYEVGNIGAPIQERVNMVVDTTTLELRFLEHMK